ncbi:FERM domain-containing protein 6 isoform X1 [Colossoma macropomum]|uniref:FERM domain-containing protein 6 isoform X1 n=1 Tax=Colossoma macropomum TaxID=42526 RepID=UPI0018641154|nr:FERM domain-containing protein 6 isoform X1 [Colossoma macropomum]XP_036428579.1 FERM domain-containing protein 6 isoform X1 [Colossoma macropomum]XP_036428580.1 FERM domain-containing protein 6 isoform X1 [Colossoma macropomum]
MTDQTRVVHVVLPDKKQLDITVGLKSRGHDIINQLSQQLGIKQLNLFGLCLENDNDHMFLDLETKLSTYFPKTWKHNTLEVMPKERTVLHLKVQYYVGNGRLIEEEKVRSLYYAELKGQVLRSRCYWQEGLYFQLAAYALQADLGDWREGQGSYFSPHDYFPPWILTKRGHDYVVQHIPALHRELRGVCVCDAVLLFIQEACKMSDVPVIFYTMNKGKKEQKASLLMGLTLSGLHVYKMVSGEQQLLYEFVWSSIDHITFQGRRFEIRSDVLAGSKLVLYTRSTLHSQHLLKHMSNSHRLHLNTKLPVKELQLSKSKAGVRHYREVYIRDKTNLDTEDSEDELPPMKFHLDKARQLQAKLAEPVSSTSENQLWGISSKGNRKKAGAASANSDETELCVDEPEEMFVDDPEEIIGLTELLEGVSVDGPLMPVSQWIDITMEMKQVLKWKACTVSLDWDSTANLHLSQSVSCPAEDSSTHLTNHHTPERGNKYQMYRQSNTNLYAARATLYPLPLSESGWGVDGWVERRRAFVSFFY